MIVGVKKVRGRPVVCKDCTSHVGKGGQIAYTDDNVNYCMDCAPNHPYSYEASEQVGIPFTRVRPEIEWHLDPKGLAPAGFIKALKYSEYMQYAYQLGKEHGKEEQKYEGL